MRCFNHADTDAVGICQQCGKFCCKQCIQDVAGQLLCRTCLELANQSRIAEEREAREDALAEAEHLRRSAAKCIRWSWIVAAGCGLVTYLILAAAPTSGPDAPPLPAYVMGPLAAYVWWGIFWGFVWFWPRWRSFVQRFKRALSGWILIARPATWLMIFFFYFVFYWSVPLTVAIYYGVFGGAFYQYKKHRKLLVQQSTIAGSELNTGYQTATVQQDSATPRNTLSRRLSAIAVGIALCLVVAVAAFLSHSHSIKSQSNNSPAPISARPNIEATPSAQPSAPSSDRASNSTIIADNFDGTTKGDSYGITYAAALNGRGAVFSRAAESRIQYRAGVPQEGTLEWWIKIDDAYRYDNFALHASENCALVFATDVQGGDVTWPGATKFMACNDGGLVLDIAQAKYNEMSHQQLKVPSSPFRFGEWHAIGISYGNKGQAIALDGKVLASDANNTQSLGAAGTHQGPADVPTIGEAVSSFWQHRQYSGGFDGVVYKFRSSAKQNDWVLAAQPTQFTSQSSSGAAPPHGPQVLTSTESTAASAPSAEMQKRAVVKTVTGTVTEISHPRAGITLTVQGSDGITYMFGVNEGEIIGTKPEAIQTGDELRVEFSNLTENYPPTYGNPVRTTLLQHQHRRSMIQGEHLAGGPAKLC